MKWSDGISAHAEAIPDKPALIVGEKVLSYNQLDERSTRLAHAFTERGVRSGDRVAIMLPNGAEFFEAGTAASKVGASVVPVNFHLKTDELTWILSDSTAKVLVTDDAVWSKVAAVAERVPSCDRIVVGGSGDDDYEAALASAGPSPASLTAPASFSPVFYTSGTTGRPKGVVHRSFASDPTSVERGQLSQVALWDWTAGDVHLLCGPAYHAGPGGWTMTALYVGATTVVMPAWDAAAWLDLVERHHVTRAFMVPAHFIRLLEHGAADRDLSSLRLIVHAAAPCPVAVKRRIIDALAPAEIWELYGMSEGGATRISPTEWLDRPGSVGTPWPGVGVRIISSSGEALSAGQTGLIYVAPAGGARFHYHNDPSKTDEAWLEDAFTVGDIGHVDADGYLYVTDRASDMVIRGGVNVYPREVEEVLYLHPDVVDCAVFGVPDPSLGERLKAMIELRSGSSVTDGDLAGWCRSRLADFKCPELIELIDTLPRDPNGKVLKRRLRDAHWSGSDLGTRPGPPSGRTPKLTAMSGFGSKGNMAEQKLFFDEVKEDDTGPQVSHELTRTDLVMYAGASGDFNPMHHDEVKAKAAGLPSVFGHGMFSAGLLAKAITDFVGIGNLRSYKVRFVKQTWPGEVLTSQVVVKAKREDGGAKMVDLECTLVNQDGEPKVAGEAVAELPVRG